MTDFDELAGAEGLAPDEEARLRRVHELLRAVGPPPELPPALLEAPAERPSGELAEFPLLMRRRVTAWVAAAAAVAAAVFLGGYALGHSRARTAPFVATHVVAMHGAGATGAIRVGTADGAGNWPMLVTVVGLPKQGDPRAYYELWLTRGGKPVAPCGAFRVHDAATTVRLSVPYRLHGYGGWVVTAVAPGGAEPGRVVLRT